MIFEEYDSWARFIATYNDRMAYWTGIFLVVIGIATPTAMFMMFGSSWQVGAVVLAAVAGATASVMARFPRLTSSGEWNVNLRSWQARIGTGLVGSLVGIGVLGSGLITITLPAPWKSATDLLNACLAPVTTPLLAGAMAPPTPAPSSPPLEAAAAECRGGGMAFILALTMLLGFSERLLTTLESKVVGASAGGPAAPKG